MGQSYKLRLGDGTILVVDHDGLGNWLSDRRALVQPAGNELWTPLRSFLVRERSAARRAAQNRSKPPATPRHALPLVYPPKPVEPKPLEEPAPGSPVVTPPAPLGTPPTPPQAPPPPLSPPPPMPRAEPTHPVRPPPAEARAEPAALPASAPEPPTLGADSAPPAEHDVGWMTLPVPPGDQAPELPAVSWLDPVATSSAGAPPSHLEDAPSPTRSRAVPALGTLLGRWIVSLARRVWSATQRGLTSEAASARGALVTLWKSPRRAQHPLPPPSPGAPAPPPAVDSERGAPAPPRPPAGARPGERVQAQKRTGPGVYRPRRAPDGLPLLELESLDDEEDDLPEIVLEPLDELPVPRPAERARPEDVANAGRGKRLRGTRDRLKA